MLTQANAIDAQRLTARFKFAVFVCVCLSFLTIANAVGSDFSPSPRFNILEDLEFLGLLALGWAAFSGIVVIPFVSDAFRRLMQRTPVAREDAVFVSQLFDYALWQLPSVLGFAGSRMGATPVFAISASVVTVIGSALWFPRRTSWAAWLEVETFPVAIEDRVQSRARERLTLWQVAERNRGRRGLVMASFIGAWSGGVGTILWAVAARPLLVGLPGLEAWIGSAIPVVSPQASAYLVSLCAGFATGCAYAAWAVRQPEWRFIQRLGARHVRATEVPVTYEALRQMSLAAGMQSVPALHVFDAEAGVNALVVGRRPETCAVAVSRGLTLEPLETQRAVLAALLSRFRDGGLSWTTILVYLIWPLSGVRRALQRTYDNVKRRSAEAVGSDDVRSALAGLAALVMFTSVLAALTVLVLVETDDVFPAAVISVFGLMASVGLFATLLGLVLVALFRGSHRAMVQSADAEGLLLLKDPQEFSQALRDVILADNNLPHLKDLGFLAFTNDDGASDELADRLEALDACAWEPM